MEIPEKLLSDWRKRVGGALHNVTSNDIETIATICAQADVDEPNTNHCVWHVAAKHFKTRCHCFQCGGDFPK